MLLLYIIAAVALVFYIRFFIINSLLKKTSRQQTLVASLKAIYFIPLFLQAVILLWVVIFHFTNIIRGFFLFFSSLLFKSGEEQNISFLKLAGYICTASLLLSVNFIAGKASLNKKIDAKNLLLKIVYAAVSYLLLQIAYLNIEVVLPGGMQDSDIIFYKKPLFMYAVAATYLIILLLPLFYKPLNKNFRYLQLGVLMSTAYIGICLLFATLLIIVLGILKIAG